MSWFALSAFALVSISSGILYWTLVESLNREDDSLLRNKLLTIAGVLEVEGIHSAALKWEVEAESSHREENKVYLRILGERGQILLETPGMDSRLPNAVFPTAPAEPGKGRGIAVVQPDGRPYRVMTADLRAPSSTGLYRVHIALDTMLERELLASYRYDLWIVLAVAFAASCGGGYSIARSGVRPIEQITATVRKIRSSNLDQRIDHAGLPQELEALVATCNDMLERLEDAFSRTSRFSSDIAHELRTPIGNLRGEAEVVLAKPRSAEEYREALSSCLEESSQVSRLIDSLLFLARAEQQNSRPEREVLHLQDELATVLEFYEPAASDSGIELSLARLDNASIEVNRVLFQRLVGNVIENALAHTPKGGAISIQTIATREQVEIQISDTGHGIPAEDLPRVFDRFYRVDRSRSRAGGGGTGLGLAIVQSVAKLHGGHVSIASRLGEGTTVTVSLPRHPEAVIC